MSLLESLKARLARLSQSGTAFVRAFRDIAHDADRGGLELLSSIAAHS